eukprot:CAMPEP_0172073216 /NCGR_PEP_ID=MMETSP1043-20130122/14733_1 /TAXON_ID=464988 /ORGANISM="Hemiselmis andersenii, Strain CCMP441" /LENGTH=377 /DNA_ID=CAMNT_0012733741 /DNA_START=553 /DNA_END=1686 /DNA_ORIENTATION=+
MNLIQIQLMQIMSPFALPYRTLSGHRSVGNPHGRAAQDTAATLAASTTDTSRFRGFYPGCPPVTPGAPACAQGGMKTAPSTLERTSKQPRSSSMRGVSVRTGSDPGLWSGGGEKNSVALETCLVGSKVLVEVTAPRAVVHHKDVAKSSTNIPEGTTSNKMERSGGADNNGLGYGAAARATGGERRIHGTSAVQVLEAGRHKGLGPKLPRPVLEVMAGLDNEEPNELVAELVEKLTPDERLILLRDLHSKKLTADGFERMDTNKDGKVDPQEFQAYMKEMNDNQFRKPTTRQMVWVMVASGVPFIGFGFMDNALMICFGETIEINIGALLGLSTMACAAGGNMVSDVVGVGMAGYIETLAKSLGIRDPLLTPSQLKMW